MTAREWFEKAQKENFAIGAFNIDNLEIFKAVCTGAKNKKSPVILQFSSGEVGYFGLSNIVDLVKNAREELEIPILLNLDHAKKIEDCLTAINTGAFDLVHFDGSDLDVVENIKLTKQVVEAAHKKNVLVEGELNRFSGSSEIHTESLDLDLARQSYTDPDAALRFVGETGIDIFAPVFGNVHGVFENQPDLDINLLVKLRGVLQNTMFALHGASGVPALQVRSAIQNGKIVKANVNTELRQAYHDSAAEKLSKEKPDYEYTNIVEEIVLAICAVVEGKIEVFGSARRV